MTFYTMAITLILVMDPLGNIPVFMTILRRFDSRTQVRIILRETLFAFVILLVFLFFGRYIMHALHLTMEGLSIAGGIILFLIAIRMIFPPPQAHEDLYGKLEPFLVPLAIPLTAGPSALATILLFTTRDPGRTPDILLALVISTAFFLLVMLCGRYLLKLFGERGLLALERLMGLILTTISVQMFLSGLSMYLKPVIS